MSTSPRLRCAIYTRKSSEEGLDQDFNSLDAQREACEAFVKSQASLGWKLSSKRYDDGGISGGTLNRPAVQELLEDIRKGLVDVVVVYKIDRLTRSLTDFAKIVDVFDEKGVSFVSVTQQFNTTTSMGRLTLNVLLSFAQFEREVTAERIRDKIAASKKKGMWMGGIVPLGYKAEDKKLVINSREAETVRYLFNRYLELGSVKKLSIEAQERGLTGRTYKQKNGVTRKTTPFGRGNLYHLLSNPIYIGKVRHQDETYEGEHEAIIDPEVWDAVHACLKSNSRERIADTNTKSSAILTGLVFDETGDRLSPVHATKNGVRYHYYISNRLSNGNAEPSDGWRIPAKQIEKPALSILEELFANPIKLGEIINLDDVTVGEHQTLSKSANRLAQNLLKSAASKKRQILASFIHRIELHQDKLSVQINATNLRALLTNEDEKTTEQSDIRTIELNHKLKKRGVEAKLVFEEPTARQPAPDPNLIKFIAKAHLWAKELTDGSAESIGDLAKQQNEDSAEISRFLPFGFLAPDIVEQILAGTQPAELTIQRLREISSLPTDWEEQRKLLGFAA